MALAVCLVMSFGTDARAVMYDGRPNLALTASLVAAGGGGGHFSSLRLLRVVAGAASGAEAAKLSNQFGAADVKRSLAIFDFTIEDVARTAAARHIALPRPSPAPSNGKALARALYRAGVTPKGTWDVGYMLEHLITHPIHHVVMGDIDAKFGSQANGEFHMVLSQMMDDLAMEYRAPAAR